MAYACPVCAEPQVDAVHLADHVAFTAIGGDDAHEAWLDETVGEWGDRSREDLAEVVVDHAEETEFPIDIDDEELGLAEQDASAHDHAHGGRRGHGHAHSEGRQQRGPPAADSSTADPPTADASTDDAPTADDETVEDVLAEAHDLTRRMQDGDEETSSNQADGDGDASTDGDASDNETQ